MRFCRALVVFLQPFFPIVWPLSQKLPISTMTPTIFAKHLIDQSLALPPPTSSPSTPGNPTKNVSYQTQIHTHLILVEEHVQLPDWDPQIRLIELVRIIPSERAELLSFLHVGVEEAEAVKHALPGALLLARREELGVAYGVTQVWSIWTNNKDVSWCNQMLKMLFWCNLSGSSSGGLYKYGAEDICSHVCLR